MLADWDRDRGLTLGLGPRYEALVAPRGHEVKDVVSQGQQLLVVRERLPSTSDLRARLQGGSELKGCGGPLVGCGLPKGRGEPRTSSSSIVTSTRTKLEHQTTRPN